jgi:hypothetical protein
MKIRITKASGAQVEVTNVAGVEIVQGGVVEIYRWEWWGTIAERNFRLDLNSTGDNITFRDKAVQWPLPETMIG